MAATDTAPAAARASSLSPAAPMQPEPFEVHQVAKETGDSFTLTLVPPRWLPFRGGGVESLVGALICSALA